MLHRQQGTDTPHLIYYPEYAKWYDITPNVEVLNFVNSSLVSVLTDAITWVVITSCADIWVYNLRKGGMFWFTPSRRRSSIVKPLSAITVSPLSNSNFSNHFSQQLCDQKYFHCTVAVTDKSCDSSTWSNTN